MPPQVARGRRMFTAPLPKRGVFYFFYFVTFAAGLALGGAAVVATDGNGFKCDGEFRE